MPLLTWGDDYSVNVKEIDRQHKKLFELINDLHDSMRNGKAREVLGLVFTELLGYTLYHFDTEEALFKKYGYPEYAQHKKEHDDLKQKVKKLKDRFDKGEMSLSITVMVFLNDWLNDHIMKVDKKYGPFLNAREVK